jgi:hypothetical protein
MRIVIKEFEVLIAEVLQSCDLRIETKSGERAWLTSELEFHLLHVISVDMYVTKTMDEIAHLKPCDLSDHVEEKSIRSNVEWYPEEDVSTALIELEAQSAISHIELHQAVARRQRHIINLGHIPR